MVMCAGCFENFERSELRKIKKDKDSYFYCRKCCEKYGVREEDKP